MRLPTLTKRQAQEEDARVLHEILWANLLRSGTQLGLRYRIYGANAREERLRLVGNLRRFWAARGYVLCSHADDAGYALWLVPKPQADKAVA